MIALACFLLGAAAESAGDTVTMDDGSSYVGTVRQDNFQQVQISTERPRRVVNCEAAHVVQVVYADAPREYVEALAQEEAGNYGAAAQAFQAILDLVRDIRENPRRHSDRRAPRDWFDRYAAFHLAECRRRAQDYRGALEMYTNLFEHSADFRLIREAYAGAMSCYVDGNDAPGAEAFLQRVQQDAGRIGQGVYDAVRARYMDLLLATDPARAIQELQQLLTSPDPQVVVETVRKIVAAMRRTNGDPAAFCRSVMNNAAMIADARAIAAVALGESLLQAAVRSHSEGDYRQAVDALLQATVVIFPGKGSGLEAEHRAGLMALGAAYEGLIDAMTADAAKNFYRTEAARTYRQIAALYPASAEAGEAQAKAAALEGQITGGGEGTGEGGGP